MNTQTANDYDLIIVGGGLVGASLALSLSGCGLKMALVEAAIPGDSQPGYDDRAIALSYGSRRIFDGLGLWADIAPDASPIRKIHVSDRGRFGFAHLDATEQGVDALGYVATARVLGRHLLGALRQKSDIELIAPARVTGFETRDQQVQLMLDQDGEIRSLGTRLLVAADGSQSFIRETLGIKTRRWEYGQSAVVANITPHLPHDGRAFERFTEAGPVALLPMTEDRCALVWTVPDEKLEEILALDDAAFIARFQARFGFRLGRFLKVGRRQSYPLTMLQAKESVRPRVAIIGNAAHALHPIAGQGFNLGLRDVAALAEVLVQAAGEGRDPGSDKVLKAYDDWRRRDQQLVGLATDALARLFGNPLTPLRAGRDLGMLALELLPGARQGFGRMAMGLGGRLPRLARGLSLD